MGTMVKETDKILESFTTETTKYEFVKAINKNYTMPKR